MLRIVYCGTPDIATDTLVALNAHPEVQIDYVISQPDRPFGRGQKLKSPEVIEKARELGLKTHQCQSINKDDDFLNQLESNPPDLFIVFAFAQFLNSRVLKIAKLGCFNIHTSLLPRHRGAAPIHYGIWKGDNTGGVSIQRMVKQMDAGDICLSNEINIAPRETTVSLYEKLKALAAKSASQFIDLTINQSLQFTPQDERQVTFAPTVKKEDGFVDPLSLSALEIDRRIRAFTPWPGVQVKFDQKRCKLIEAQATSTDIPPSKLRVLDNELYLGCQEGSLKIERLQLEGKVVVDAKSWLNGQQGNLPEVHSLLESL